MSSSSTSIVCEKSYRAAIALNNQAVDMLERSCDKQAAATFQNALDLIRAASFKTPESERPGISGIENRMKQATERLAKPSPLKRRCPGMTFTILADDDDCVAAIESVSQSTARMERAGAAPHAILIRIEEYGSESISKRDVDLDCAIILQNFGLSYLSLTASAVSRADRHNLRRNAVRLLQLSQAIISSRTSASNAKDDDILEKLFCVSLISTKSLAQGLMAAGQEEDKVRQCLDHLASLKAVIRQMGFVSVASNKTVAAAA